MSASLIIPNWNREDLLTRLLDSLKAQSRPPAEVIVVDNGSSDNSVETARRHGARVIEMGANTGFSRAVNRGIREARAGLIGVLNNDVELEPSWLAALQSALGGEYWFAAGRVRDARRRDLLDGAFDTLCRGACAWRAGQGRPDGPEWSRRRPIHFASFTAALFRAELFERVGLLDERFESYLEDVDFGLRCALAGFGGVYVPEAICYHSASATLGRWHPDSVRRIARNQLFLVAKHYPRGWGRRYGWPVLVAQTLWGLVALRHGAGWAWLRGKWEGWRRFRELRPAAPASDAGLAELLRENEIGLRDLQRRTGFDPYWRLYFALT